MWGWTKNESRGEGHPRARQRRGLTRVEAPAIGKQPGRRIGLQIGQRRGPRCQGMQARAVSVRRPSINRCAPTRHASFPSTGGKASQSAKPGEIATPVSECGQRLWRRVSSAPSAGSIVGEVFCDENLGADDGAIGEVADAAAQDGGARQAAFGLNGFLEFGRRNRAFSGLGAGADAEEGETIIRLCRVPGG